MDLDKCNALKDELASQPDLPLVAIDRFFDGNDDLGSIGCNLSEHPGIERFREVFAALAARPDVESVYAQIAELDPDDDAWPFTDTVLVVGDIDEATLQAHVEELMPDLVEPAIPRTVPPELRERHKGRVWVVWWD
jgi:hypothetical protein